MSTPSRPFVNERRRDKRTKPAVVEEKPDIEPILLQSSRGYVSLRSSSKKDADELRSSLKSGGEQAASPGYIPRNSAPKFLPFVIQSSRAKEHMIAWRDKLFMVPVNMTQRFRSAEIEAFWCPFFLFSANVITSRTVRVLEDFPAAMPCCDPMMRATSRSNLKETVTVLTREMVANLNPWPFQKGITLDTAAIMNNPANCKLSADQKSEIGMKVVSKNVTCSLHRMPALSPEKVWEKEVAPMLKEQLKSNDGEVLGFANITHHVVFVPLYFSRYSHEGKGYSFVLNGVNGVCWGESPRGVGGLFHGLLKLFTGGRTATEANVGVITGEDLNSLDCADVYDPKAVFFDLPAADQFLLSSATGYAELENVSEEPVELRAQWRGERKFAKTVTVYAHEKVEFSFAYKWCLQIMKGNPEQIHWNILSTCGGGDKPDRFGMVSPTMGLSESDLSLSAFVEEEEEKK